jgi:cytochrome P450
MLRARGGGQRLDLGQASGSPRRGSPLDHCRKENVFSEYDNLILAAGSWEPELVDAGEVGRDSPTVEGDRTRMTEIYYDPYDFEIDNNPHAVWRRLRDVAPLYRNDRYDFWALSRFEDVASGLADWRTYSSARGTVLEFLRNKVKLPPGIMLFEDPPLHDAHRALLARVFTPRRIAEIEPQVRAYCARSLDRLVGSGSLNFITDLGSQMPMRVIGMLLGIPEEDQEELRDHIDAGLSLDEGGRPSRKSVEGEGALFPTARYAEYIEWRRKHPSDDLMTELLTARFVDDQGIERGLRDDELLSYIGLLAGAGNETTTRLIGWTGYLLDRFPDQRRLIAENRSLIPNAIEEILRYEAPSPVQGRYVTRDVELHGTRVPEGSTLLLLNGSANRDEREFEDPDRLDVERKNIRHLSFGYGIHFCLGASLARLEGCVALDEVLSRWPDWEVDHASAVMARTSSVRGWRSLPARI